MAWRGLRGALPAGMADRVPAVHVTHEMATRYCAWLDARSADALPPRRYRLPTEVEWEYAARAGGEGRFCFGDHAEHARFFARCEGRVVPYVIGQCMPSFFGLFDLHGGVWEWTASKYPPALMNAPRADRRLIDQTYLFKGGAYYSPAVRCRPSQRNREYRLYSDRYLGFRVVMEPGKS